MSDSTATKTPQFDSSRLREAFDRCSDSGDTLRCLYTEYSERMRNRGAHIWTTAAVFIPLSLSGVVVVRGETAGPLALSSSLLIWAWVVISELMRAELARRRSVCAALETAMLKLETPLGQYGLTELLTPGERRRGFIVLERFTRRFSTLRAVRVAIAGAVTLFWIWLWRTMTP